MPESIALAQLKGLLADGVQLVHVLPPEEYAAEHLPGGRQRPAQAARRREWDHWWRAGSRSRRVRRSKRAAMPSRGRSVVAADQSRIPGFPSCDRGLGGVTHPPARPCERTTPCAHLRREPPCP